MVLVVNNQSVSVLLSTLAADAVISAAINIDAGRERGVFLKKFKVAMDWDVKTDGEGPLRWGIASTSLTNAEIAECLIADPQNDNDVPASEQARRKVMTVGVIPRNGAGSSQDRLKLQTVNWPWKKLDEGEGIKFWVMNDDSDALSDLAIVNWAYVAVQEWLDD